MKIPLINVGLAHMNIKVPVISDAETTRRIAEMVNKRLEIIEHESTSINTHQFALEAAMQFAAELEQTKKAYKAYVDQAEAREEQETREVLVALNKISEDLRALLKKA